MPVLSYVHELEFAIRGMKPSVVSGTLEQTDHYEELAQKVKSALHDLFAIKEESVSVAKGFISLRDLDEFGQLKREVSSKDGAESMPFHVGVLANMDYRKESTGSSAFFQSFLPALEPAKSNGLGVGKGRVL